MDQWVGVSTLTNNPEYDGTPFWGFMNPQRITAVKITMINDPVAGRDVFYPEVVSPDLGTTRVLLNVRESLGFLAASDAEAAILDYMGGRDQ